jgi:hypothetical protein
MPMEEFMRIALYAAMCLALICMVANIIHKRTYHDRQLYYIQNSKVFWGIINGLTVLVILVFVGAVSSVVFMIALFGSVIFQDSYSIVMRRKAVKNASQTDPVLQ